MILKKKLSITCFIASDLSSLATHLNHVFIVIFNRKKNTVFNCPYNWMAYIKISLHGMEVLTIGDTNYSQY